MREEVVSKTPIGVGALSGALQKGWGQVTYEKASGLSYGGTFSFSNETYASRPQSWGNFYYGYLWEFGADPKWPMHDSERVVKHNGRWFSSQAVGGMISPLLPRYEQLAADKVQEAVNDIMEFKSQGFYQ